MTITEFARSRGVLPQTVSTYMARHNMSYDKRVGLTDEQIEALDAVYPLPAPVEVIQGIPESEHYKIIEEKDKQIQALQERVISLQKEVINQTATIGELSTQRALLEDRASSAASQIDTLNAEIDRLKKRSLLDRIFNK